MDEVIIGIDLGTTNSEVAVLIDGKIEIVADNGSPIVPSCVYVDGEGKPVVGLEARNQQLVFPENTVSSVKRKMGGDEKIPLAGREYLPQEISAMILRKLKQMAEGRLGQSVGKAVITVPAMFSDAQRQATRDAGAIAGLEVVRIINEPTAACLAYNSDESAKAMKILAFDLGGGTFDVSLVNMEGDVVEVISSHGDNHLGGDDFDKLVVDWISAEIGGKGKTPEFSIPATHRLKRSAETARIHLSDNPFAKIIEDNLRTVDGGVESLNRELDRINFNDMIAPLVDKMIAATRQCLADAKLKIVNIDKIILVGGATRTPFIQEKLEEELGKRPSSEVHPDLSVAYGAGVMAARLMGSNTERVLIDITPYTFGTSAIGDINGNFTLEQFVPVIKAGTPLPVLKSEAFLTVADNQEKVDCKIFQGENPDALRNILIGRFMMEGLSKVPSGNEVLVNMRLDLDGILHVSCVEKSTGLAKHITIQDALAKLSKEQIDESRKAIKELFGDADDDIIDAEEAFDDVDDDPHADGDAEDIKFPGSSAAALADLGTTPKDLRERVEAAAGSMDEADRREARELLAKIEAAVKKDDQKTVKKAAGILEDLLFYAEDN